MSIEGIKSRMTVDKVILTNTPHPPRRPVKFFPVASAKDMKGQNVVVDNSDWVGQYPILWSRSVGNSERLVVMLVDDDKGLTAHGVLSEADFLKLPETEIEW